MDRASDSGSEGWGFESLPVYQTVQIRTFYQLVKGSDLLFSSARDSKNKMWRGWAPLATAWRSETLIVRVPSGVPIKDAVDDTIHCVFYLCIEMGTRKIQSQYAGGILLQPVQKLVATLIFARPLQGQKCKRISGGSPKETNPNYFLNRNWFGFVIYCEYPHWHEKDLLGLARVQLKGWYSNLCHMNTA